MNTRITSLLRRLKRLDLLFLLIALLLPLLDGLLAKWNLQPSDVMRTILVFMIMGMGLNIVTGFTGLLNLGSAAFMAIGAYSYSILTCNIYPFQIGFWPAALLAPVIGALAGLALGAPTLRLRGDYIAIVTLGFGEIIQDVIRNVDVITKGTQGINPLPGPVLGNLSFTPVDTRPWYYLLLGFLVVVTVLTRFLENSRIGRGWVAIREDELAATCMGVNAVKFKLMAFATGAGFCALAGALWVALLSSSGEPGNYDFMVSILAVCVVIVGGLGSVTGVFVGALVMVGLDSIVISNLLSYLARKELVNPSSIFGSASGWKFITFGLALVLMMRFKPEGLLPSRRVKTELHGGDEPPPSATPQSEPRRPEVSP